MKGLIVSIVVLVLAACTGSAVYAIDIVTGIEPVRQFSGPAPTAASQTSDKAGVLLTVGPVFNFAIGEDVVDMGTVVEGNAGVGGVTMYCSTNQGRPWQLQVRSDRIHGGSTGAFIDQKALQFQTYALPDSGGVDSAGTFVTTNMPFSRFDRLAYTAAESEHSDTDVRVGMVLVLYVPYGTRADTYAVTVTATMAE